MGNDLNRMRIDASPARVQRQCMAWRNAGMVVALVPTMGALHKGHRALIRAARTRADKVVVSIFVNPAQFNPREDLSRYPRPLETDCAACRAEGADMVFTPSPAAMYPPGFSTWVNEESLSTPLCGASRPGHFRGVCTVVTKLFMICQPHLAFFGWKDAQQTLVITRMVRDLDMPVKIVLCPTVREKDGLAMSSRNVYLTPDQRRQAPRIHAALKDTVQLHRRGAGMARMRQHLHNALKRIPGAEVDYAEILDQATLEPVAKPHKGQPMLMAVAVRMGSTRLIDNERFMW